MDTFDRIIDVVPVLAWCTHPDGTNEFMNQQWCNYTGTTSEQARGWGWQVSIHPEDLPTVGAKWSAALASGEPGEIEGRLRRHDGVYRWFLFRANPLRDESGKIVKWYGTNTDIDDLKRIEQELRRSEAFLAEAQRLSLTGSFAWHPETDENIWSDQLYRMFEFEPGTIITKERVRSRIHPDDVGPFNVWARGEMADGSHWEHEYRLCMPDGSIKYAHLVAHATRDSHGALEYVGAVQDVTRRKQAEAALGKARTELAHVSRVTTLGSLTATIAHEVNQPLSGIITNANTCLRMLAAEPPNIDGARETVKRTLRDGSRASDVITHLRALFGKKDAVMDSLDLNETIGEVITLTLGELQRSGVVLRTQLSGDLPAVTGDRIQLQQVILNLMRNASDSMSEVNDRPRILTIGSAAEEGNRVLVTVEDAGIGLGQLEMDRLFQAFYTTKPSGMGIGLSVSRSIIENHQGRLWATQNDGPGATFCFSIPCQPIP